MRYIVWPDSWRQIVPERPFSEPLLLAPRDAYPKRGPSQTFINQSDSRWDGFAPFILLFF
jgi:hypothetical protein